MIPWVEPERWSVPLHHAKPHPPEMVLAFGCKSPKTTSSKLGYGTICSGSASNIFPSFEDYNDVGPRHLYLSSLNADKPALEWCRHKSTNCMALGDVQLVAEAVLLWCGSTIPNSSAKIDGDWHSSYCFNAAAPPPPPPQSGCLFGDTVNLGGRLHGSHTNKISYR